MLWKFAANPLEISTLVSLNICFLSQLMAELCLPSDADFFFNISLFYFDPGELIKTSVVPRQLMEHARCWDDPERDNTCWLTNFIFML